MKIAIQGEPGSFSHEAAIKMQPGGTIVPCALSAEVFAKLAAGEADVAVIPIENSLAGSVSEHFDLLLQQDVTVVREELLRIRHNLIGIAGSNMEEIDRVYSHPVALAQCRHFLASHPRMKVYAFYDTAGSVKQVIETGDQHAAAIASKAAASNYGAQILQGDIEDNPENYTRFFLVYRAGEAKFSEDANKVSLAFALANKPGSLVAALNEFAALGVNMTKIESRPVAGKPWEYIFFVDCQLTCSADADKAMAAIQPHCSMVKELGRYREGLLLP